MLVLDVRLVAGRRAANFFSVEDTGVNRRDASDAVKSRMLSIPYRPMRLQSSPIGSNPKLLFTFSDVIAFVLHLENIPACAKKRLSVALWLPYWHSNKRLGA